MERQRVVTKENRDDVLVLRNLSKVYRRGLTKVLAVNNLCLGVPEGECFGLLGVNGAGKTTSFKMITGEIQPTRGAAIIGGQKVSGGLSKIEQDLGYCPQDEALDPMLTATEMIYFYSRLKGISTHDMATVTKSAIQRFGLEAWANKPVKTYSGGTKRKLSTALALLGEPQLILLDEPTTGMDPSTRRLVWNNVIGVVKDGRSVILTSHSMAECDALCTRLAIMVNGNFMCLGSGQHLKNTFGGSYTVKVRASSQMLNQQVVVDFILASFPGSFLKSRHHNLLEFEVPGHTCSLADLFGMLEREKASMHINDYSIAQTTLDKLFVDFAQHQTDGQTVVGGAGAAKHRPTYTGLSAAHGCTNQAYDTLVDCQRKPQSDPSEARQSPHALSESKQPGLMVAHSGVLDTEPQPATTAPPPPPEVVIAPALLRAQMIAQGEVGDAYDGDDPVEGVILADQMAGVSEIEYIPGKSVSVRL